MNRAHRSPLVRLLRNPEQELTHALTTLPRAFEHLLPLMLAGGACALAALGMRLLLAGVRARRLARGARLLELAVPPELEPDGALLLWSSLHDLLRPRLARLLTGQPQLAWEIAADHRGSRFRIWVPATVPPGLVERALASAWPGITTTPDTSADDEHPAEAPGEEAA